MPALETRPPSLDTLRPPDREKDESAKTADELILKRKHPTIRAREQQLFYNLLALYGGRPYVERRLSRFVGERKISWEGGTRSDGVFVTGRKEQAHVIPYPGRIAEKINQYLFAEPATRDGADADFLDNTDRDGQSVHQFFREVNSYLTACRWCWIGVDMPTVPDGISVAQKEQMKVRPYWVAWRPDMVKDWRFDATGELEWIITESIRLDNSDPRKAAVQVTVRSLWTRGNKYDVWEDPISKTMKSQNTELSLKSTIPIFPVGKPSPLPYLWDDIESMNRTIMDLESVSRQNYFDRAFPQMYLPASTLASIQQLFDQGSPLDALEKVIGMNTPILLAPEDQTPGYIMPDGGNLEAIDRKTERLRTELYTSVGLMLRSESRAAQSGEAKAWDFLEVEQLMKDRALMLEEAERRAIEISKEWDSSFKEYNPQWPKKFSIRDFAADIASLIDLTAVPMPEGMSKELLKKLLEAMNKIGQNELPAEKLAELRDQIDDYKDESITLLERLAAGNRRTQIDENSDAE